MRKLAICILYLLGVYALLANVPIRYYIGTAEISEAAFYSVPDTLKGFISEFDYDTVIVKTLELPFTHCLDPQSTFEKVLISKRSDEEIKSILEQLKSKRNDYEREILRLHIGDTVPAFGLKKFGLPDVNNNIINGDTCYLISFWATWCGNCLEDLKAEHLPAIAKGFSNNSKFRFITICIDATENDLNKFFDGPVGSKWKHLKDITYIDTDREVNNLFAKGGNLPLTVVAGRDNNIKYIHLGKVAEKADLKKLNDIIEENVSL